MAKFSKLGLVVTVLALVVMGTPVRADDLPFQATNVVATYTNIQDNGDGSYEYTSDIEGTGTTLGDFSGFSVVDYDFNTQLLSNGTMVLYGADGSITMTFDGMIDSSTGEFIGVTFTVIDGDGAYQGATGDGDITGVADATNGAIINFDGIITTP